MGTFFRTITEIFRQSLCRFFFRFSVLIRLQFCAIVCVFFFYVFVVCEMHSHNAKNISHGESICGKTKIIPLIGGSQNCVCSQLASGDSRKFQYKIISYPPAKDKRGCSLKCKPCKPETVRNIR